MTNQTMTLDMDVDGNADFQDMPALQIPPKKSLPTGIASNVKQHVIIVFDRSSSMYGSKIAESNQAREALIQELAVPENKDGFRVTGVDFNHEADRVFFAQSAVGLFVPPSNADGYTCFEEAVSETIAAILEHKNLPNDEGWHFLKPIVLFMSDGQSDVDDQSLKALHEGATVMAIAYGSDADESTLKRIASDGKVHVVGTSGSALRSFLSQVGQTLSEDLAAA